MMFSIMKKYWGKKFWRGKNIFLYKCSFINGTDLSINKVNKSLLRTMLFHWLLRNKIKLSRYLVMDLSKAQYMQPFFNKTMKILINWFNTWTIKKIIIRLNVDKCKVMNLKNPKSRTFEKRYPGFTHRYF